MHPHPLCRDTCHGLSPLILISICIIFSLCASLCGSETHFSVLCVRLYQPFSHFVYIIPGTRNNRKQYACLLLFVGLARWLLFWVRFLLSILLILLKNTPKGTTIRLIRLVSIFWTWWWLLDRPFSDITQTRRINSVTGETPQTIRTKAAEIGWVVGGWVVGFLAGWLLVI